MAQFMYFCSVMEASGKNATFRFKQFEVRNCRSAMRVSTDAVALGAWAPLPSVCRTVWDLGAGTGVLSLMVAQRSVDSHARITAFEIEPEAAEEAAGNFAASPWTDRLSIAEGDACLLCGQLGEVDMIISNPPYFSDKRQGLRSPDDKRSLARHSATMDYAAIIHIAAGHLSPGGLLCMIAPTEFEEDITWSAALHRLHVIRRCYLCSLPGRKPKRIMLCLSRTASQPVTETISIQSASGGRTPEFQQLTGAFYL